jgi:hypothetical protein
MFEEAKYVLTAPVTVASAEKSFLELKLIQNYLTWVFFFSTTVDRK